MEKFLVKTQKWYQQDSAEKLANLTATSLELLLETNVQKVPKSEAARRKIIQDFNIIFSQQILHQNVQEVCLLIEVDSSVIAIDEGQNLYTYFFGGGKNVVQGSGLHRRAVQMYQELKNDMRASEEIHTVLEGNQTYHIFVPFVPRGEYAGVLYMKNTPDFSFITKGMISGFDETTMIYSALILLGLLAMFYISSYTLKERNRAQQLLFEEQKQHLAEQINYRNELLFTKRIYHTYHKAERVMGFIKEDVRNLAGSCTEKAKERITKYANFVAHVIYDTKWYHPPIQTIRGPLFKTDINASIRFLVDNVFKRVSSDKDAVRFDLDLDSHLPDVQVNEYVVWELLEPLIQNSIDHAGNSDLLISIKTHYDSESKVSSIVITDNGKGIEPWLLERNEDGIKRIFLEHTSTKLGSMGRHSGYGCYIAYEIAKERCGWELDAENLELGCRFIVSIPQP
ncbi:MAG: ATP-binding protein [Bacteroidota bacterium]